MDDSWGLFDDGESESNYAGWGIFGLDGINPNINPNKKLLELGTSVRFYDVNRLYDLFCDHLQIEDELIISAKNVAQVDTAGIQLICSLAKSASEKNIPFMWESASETIQKQIDFLSIDINMNSTCLSNNI